MAQLNQQPIHKPDPKKPEAAKQPKFNTQNAAEMRIS